MPPDDDAFKLSGHAIKQVLDRETFAEGEVIFTEGNYGKSAYILLRGEVAITTKNKAGQEVVLTTVQKGQMFGELALMTDSRRTATATARTACEVLYINQEKLQNKLDSADPFLKFWIQYLCQRLVELSKRAK